jgi:FtsH-binding integral membrane protein
MSDNRYAIPKARDTAIDAGLRAHMQRVYNAMAMGLVVTGAVAWYISKTPAIFQAVSGTPLQWVVMLAPLGIIFFGLTPASIQRKSLGTIVSLYILLTALFGVSLSYIFTLYTPDSIARVFFITSGMFAGTSIYGYTTKKDLTSFGSLMFMGLIGILIAGVVNIFMQSAMVHFVTSIIGVIVFTGLTAWDTQYIKESYRHAGAGDSAAKIAIMGALNLYLNFINLFVMLLRLFGNRQ